MLTERLKDDRALPIQTPFGSAFAAWSSMNRTSGVHLRLMSTDHDSDADLRDTLPPTPATEPPRAFNPPPSAALMKLAGYDPDQFLHAALVAAADGAHENREGRKDIGLQLKDAVKQLDDAAEARSAARTKEIKADFELTNREVQKLATQVGDLAQTVRQKVLPWMTKVDKRLETGEERFESIEHELAAMRSQVAGLDQLHARMDQLEQELAMLREGSKNVAAPAAETPPKLEPPAGG